LFEVPAVHAAAQIVCDLPDGSVQFSAFLLFGCIEIICHL